MDVEFDCGLDLAFALARNLGTSISLTARFQLRAHLTYSHYSTRSTLDYMIHVWLMKPCNVVTNGNAVSPALIPKSTSEDPTLLSSLFKVTHLSIARRQPITGYRAAPTQPYLVA
jgi:hypothetical protein